jgi:hypothetical protein
MDGQTGGGPRRRQARAQARSRHLEDTQEVISEPSVFDVLLGRGRGIQMHPGNQRFQGTSLTIAQHRIVLSCLHTTCQSC